MLTSSSFYQLVSRRFLITKRQPVTVAPTVAAVDAIAGLHDEFSTREPGSNGTDSPEHQELRGSNE